MWLPKKAARVLHTPEDLGMLNFFVALVAQFGNKELCLEAPIFVRPRRAVLYKHRLSCACHSYSAC